MLSHLSRLALAALFCLGLAAPALSQDGVMIADPYARVLQGKGVAYFRIDNHSGQPDRLISVTTDIGHAMLMTNEQDANGMMQMRDAPDGFTIDPGASRVLQPAGDHVMLMHLMSEPAQGQTLTLTLTFEQAGVVTLTLPVDNSRRSPPGMGPTPFDTSSQPAD